jgi:tRNA U34 2-thiouridine synthase MnmA/TrmU
MPASVVRAREVAAKFGVPFRLSDLRDEFREGVLAYFVKEKT